MENIELFLKEFEAYINAKKELQELKVATASTVQGDSYKLQEKYDRLKSDSVSFVSQISPTIRSVGSVYKSVALNSSGYLCIYGNPPHINDYDFENCFSVFSQSQASVKSSLVSLITMIKQHQNNQSQIQQLLYSVCVNYNTVVEIGVRASEMARDAVLSSRRVSEIKLKSVKDRISAFERKYPRVDSRIDEIVDNNKQMKKRISAHNNMPIAKEFTNEIKIPLGYDVLRSNKELFGNEQIISTIDYWEPKKDGILYLNSQGVRKSEISSIVQNIIINFLHAYPVKATKVAFCDMSKDEQLINFSGVITGKNLTKLVYGGRREVAIFEDEGEIKSLFATLSYNRATRLTLFSRSNVSDIFEYNRKNKDNIQPLMLVLINDYSELKYRRSIKEIYSIANELKKVGIYLVVVQDDARQPITERGYSNEDPLDIKVKASKYCDLVKEYNSIFALDEGRKYFVANLSSDFELSRVMESYKKAYESEKSAIALRSIFQEKSDGDTIYKLSIPIGKQGSSVVNINLSMDDSTVHAVISGMTGSGKSSLLQDIVLAGAYKYSPKEVEFWVLDFKDGKGFEKFESLKHVRMMSLKNKKSETEEIMGYLMEEKTRRDNLFDNLARKYNIDVSDIKKYNKHAVNYGLEPLPRVVVVIDEYTQMNIKCVPTLAKIAQQGRSYGISLVMCSQLVDTNFNDVITQINNRFEFENPKYGALINTRGKDDDRSMNGGKSLGEESSDGMFLGELTGNCIFSSGNGALKQMRAAYESDLVACISKINEKYKNIPTNPPIVIGRPRRLLKSITGFKIADKVEHNEIPLGQTRKGDIVSYTVGRNNPLVLVMGSGARCSSIEYSIINSFKKLSKGEKNIYYFDLSNGSYEEDNIIEKYASDIENLRFSNNLLKAKSLLIELSEEYKKRQLSYNAREDSQINVIIHYTDELETYVKAFEQQAMSQQNQSAFSEGPARASRRAAQLAMGEFNIMSILTNLVCYGKNYGIYVTLHFGDSKKIDSITTLVSQLTNSTHSLKITQTAIIVPDVPEKSESEFRRNNNIAEEANRVNSYIRLIDRTIDAGYEKEKQKDLEEEDFVYAILAQNLLSKFIPYEWRKRNDI